MGTSKMTARAVAMLAGAWLGGCAEATTAGACGDGETVDVNGSSYCVYEESLVIVGGFDCPAAMPYRIDFEHATVCGSQGFDGIDVPDDICARAFVPCTEAEPDAGVCDNGFGDCNGVTADGCETPLNTVSDCGTCAAACSLPNASASCDNEQCALLACDVGFADCDGDLSNGCEAALNTLTNCGLCGAACSGHNVICESGTCTPLPVAVDCSGGSTYGSAVECQATSLSCYALPSGESCGLCLDTISCQEEGCPDYSPFAPEVECFNKLSVHEGVCGSIRYRYDSSGYGGGTSYWDVATGHWLASVSHNDYNAFCDGASFSVVMGDPAVVVGCKIETEASPNLCSQ